MEKTTNFIVSAEFLKDDDSLALAEDEYKNPLLTWVKLVFADDEPNANNQGISQSEFPSLIKSMAYMPIKAKYDVELGLEGHEGAQQIGVIKAGQQQGNKLIAVGALYNDEFPEIVDFFRNEATKGNRIDFSWEIRYRDSEVTNGIEWLKQVTTKAITAVKEPAYDGRTSLLSISTESLLKMIDEEIKEREFSSV